jgi:hypothetical protein
MATITWRCAMPARFVHVSVYVVTDVSVTIVAWPRVTGPTPLSIAHVGSGNVGSIAYVHDHVTIVGVPAGTDDGVATNDVMPGMISGASVPTPSRPPSPGLSEPPPHAATAISKANRFIGPPPKKTAALIMQAFLALREKATDGMRESLVSLHVAFSAHG